MLYMRQEVTNIFSRLVSDHDCPISTLQVAGIAGMNHYAWPICSFKLYCITFCEPIVIQAYYWQAFGFSEFGTII
jgi:hypothetical protein